MKGKTVKFLSAVLAVGVGVVPMLGANMTYVRAAEELPGAVSLQKENETTFTFGNEYLKRSFSVAERKLKTTAITNYRTGTSPTTITPQAGSEEFIIKTLPNSLKQDETVTEPGGKIEKETGWEITSDSVSTSEGTNGAAEKMFDGDLSTYYHSKYENGATDEEKKYPHNIYVDFKNEKTIASFAYHQRTVNNEHTQASDSGHVKKYKVFVGESKEALQKLDIETAQADAEGEFDDQLVNYVNLKETKKGKAMRIVFVDCHTPKGNSSADVASCAEFKLYSEKANLPEKGVDDIHTSDMTLKGDPRVETDANTGVTTLTFDFEPITSRGVSYTISEVFTMKAGDSFMRKHLNITADQPGEAIIDHIDLEHIVLPDEALAKDTYWTIPEQKNNAEMAGMKGDYLELGQPYYVGAMYWGSEFPETENKIDAKNKLSFVRYWYGKSLDYTKDKFTYNEEKVPGQMTTWDAVVGSARSTDYLVCQNDFYEYIETIATKTEFRQQFNSWYDNMKDITAQNILESFAEVEKGFTQNGVEPLDSYVVDDGWVNYNSSFWGFNNKFPNELYDSSLQVNQMGSNFGLWLGPRGGYGTQTTIANWIEQNNLGSVNHQSGNDINISDARYLNKLRDDIFNNYQEKFDINYWKLDGMLLEPSRDDSEYYISAKKNPFYTISETYERWTDVFESMRDQRNGKDLWLNMTSYTNPSPWHLQWVNSVWMQNTGDTGFCEKFDNTNEESMLTYRDQDYYEFFNDRQWQLPNKYFYNHDPVYAKTAHRVPTSPNQNKPIEYTDEELREHLYMLGTRGTAFWEYYYSPSMFDDNKWQINAEAANWIEDNFEILQKSKMFGGSPANGDPYGYSAWNGNNGIVSLRNPSNVKKEITVTYDRLLGVPEDLKPVFGKVVIGDNKYNNAEMGYGRKVTYTLEPKEVLIMQYGDKDTVPAEIASIHANGKVVKVEFNETMQEPDKSQYTVDGYEVKKAELQADRRTVALTLNKDVEDLSNITVHVNGAKDTVGNASKTEKTDDVYVEDIITGIADLHTDGTPIVKNAVHSVDGHKDFSIVGKIKTESTNAVLAAQDGVYSLGIDENGYLTFSFGGLTANSAYTEKLIENGNVNAYERGKINDGKEHDIAAVKEVNGMIKLYVDGKVAASAYAEEGCNPEVAKADTVFVDRMVGTATLTVLDRAVAFDEAASYIDSRMNVVLARNNKDVKVTEKDVTSNSAPTYNNDAPKNKLNDGNKDTNNYFELSDTPDRKNHSRYIQVDLGKSYDLNEVVLTRYFSDSRKYGPTVIMLSEDEKFPENKRNIIFNSDATGEVHKVGKGKDALYAETANGKSIVLDEPCKARYIRIYVSGRDGNAGTSDHFVELEAYANIPGQTLPTRISYDELEALVDLEAYTTSSVTAYKNTADVKAALKEAKQILKDRNEKNDENIVRLTNVLNEHRSVLVKRADIKPAQDMLAMVEQAGLVKDKYTEESWKAFETAKKAVESAVADNSDVNDAQLADMLKNLETAGKGLVKKEPATSPAPAVSPKPEQPSPAPSEQPTVSPDPSAKPSDDKRPATGDTRSAMPWAFVLAGALAAGLVIKKH